MAKLKPGYENVLRVNILDKAPVYVTREGQRSKFTMQTLTNVEWYNHKRGDNPRPIEFRATPLDAMDLPEELFGFQYIPSEYQRASWYFLEKIVPERGVPNEYLVHGDYLIPLNAEYPAIISMLPHLQETLALAQLEAAKLAGHPELRLDVADRLMVYLTNIGVNVLPYHRKD